MLFKSPKSTPQSGPSEHLPLYRTEGRGLGVLFEDVAVFGAPRVQRQVDDTSHLFLNIFKWPVDQAMRFAGNRRLAPRSIVQDLTGVLFPGETAIVLGNPGAGCSTTLKVIANQHQEFSSVEGSIQYASISGKALSADLQSEIVYNNEDDIHIPHLKVKDTMDFALRLRKPAAEKESDKLFSSNMTQSILQSLGIAHTADTIVGNSFVRGVSGGERKRVSLAEVLAANPSIVAWDNPIRGLDSSSAFDFLYMLKQLSRQVGMTNAVSLYQASEPMYQECFDKVILLYEGRLIFFGPVSRAKAYFESLGFQQLHRQTTPEFLTAITAPNERRIRPEYTGPLYLDPDSLASRFRSSDIYTQLLEEISRYKAEIATPAAEVAFRQEVWRTVDRYRILKNMTSSLRHQIMVSLQRYFRLLWSDRISFFTIIALCVVNALLCGSAFYDIPATATGSYVRSCAVFFPLIYFLLNALTEVKATIDARDILLKQQQLGMVHPVAYVLTETLGGIPTAFLQTILFSCLFYFLVGLSKSAAQFWIFELILFVYYLSYSALFRMMGAWAPNLSVGFLMSGCGTPLTLAWAGYGPPWPTMLGWSSWIRRISPSPYALEALMTNEFEGLQLHCTPEELVPSGPSFNDVAHQGCPLPGAMPGETTTSGSYYLQEVYDYHHHHLWRNFGIIIAFWVAYTILASIGLTVMTRSKSNASGPVFKSGADVGHDGVTPKNHDVDLEKQQQPGQQRCDPSSESDGGVTLMPDEPPKADEMSSVFTFEDINYTVSVAGKPKRLLNGVNGYVRAGQLTALMGASGAGKTTLLDVLSQRKSQGQVEGHMQLNSCDISASFARSCGFVQQGDIHEPLSTVREALQFSAYLRQPAEVSEAEKAAYAEHVIRLLELESIADAVIGEPGDGKLGVEERKRVTIGVELAARPSALLFLDEPTSGLDSQAAYSIVRFLRRIVAEGIPIVCTIHQPSGVIFEMFDHVLLLAPGGNTVYFGETGDGCEELVEYFAKYGENMDDNQNPAEFIISAVNKKPAIRDWAQTWRDSPEAASLRQRIDDLKRQLRSNAQSEDASQQSTFAQPLGKQMYALTIRHARTIWRHGPYNLSRFTKSIFYSLIISFSYFQADTDVLSLQNRAVSVLIISWIIPVIAADFHAIWFDRWSIFEGRERNGIYDYKALLFALIIVEIPWNLVLWTLVFLCNYWTIGFTNATTNAGFTYFSYLLLSLFCIGFCFLMPSLFGTKTLAGYASSLFWVLLMMFSGMLQPHIGMNDFYRPWLFWVDPMRYFIGAIVSSAMNEVEVHCAERDLAHFIPPAGETCYDYAASFLETSAGYLLNPNGTEGCSYCKYTTGNDYLDTLDYAYADRWRDWAVFLGWCLVNFGLIWFVTWVSRIRFRLA
ncbi:ABC drug exporter [Colletotrichum karsti]|uniref:ABC drug exporter n=1 Tax=Colletotrichum karsti TaxID=1095194 RepID=A0A9P6LG66_9PEZI|nr:ABC drug exporter [Colletotrichum karsti]KAF9871112.1 ABC drug exporter [Colletotrichum karsti]